MFETPIARLSAAAIVLLGIGSGTCRAQVKSSDGVFQVNPAAIAFGDQKINRQSSPQIIGFNALGPVPNPKFTVSLTGPDAADFINATFCGNFAYCRQYVVFSPHMPGAKSATATISDGTASISVPLTGNAVVNGSFEIVNNLTAKGLDIGGNLGANGAPVVQHALGGLPQQRWTVEPVDAEYYKITNVMTGKVLDVTDYSVVSGARIQEFDDLGGMNQQWLLRPIDDVHFAIINRLSGKALDVTNGSIQDGTPIQQYDFIGDQQQLWVLLPADSYTIGSFSTLGADWCWMCPEG